MITFGLDLAAQATIERTTSGGDAGGTKFPSSPVNGQPFLVSEDIEGYPKGLYVWSELRNDWIPQLSDYYAYDVAMTLPRRYKADDTIARFLSVRTTSIRPNFEGSRALSDIAPTADVSFPIHVENGQNKETTHIGDIHFKAGESIGNISAVVPDSMYVLVAGDILCIKSPSLVNYGLLGTSITICGAMVM